MKTILTINMDHSKVSKKMPKQWIEGVENEQIEKYFRNAPKTQNMFIVTIRSKVAIAMRLNCTFKMIAKVMKKDHASIISCINNHVQIPLKHDYLKYIEEQIYPLNDYNGKELLMKIYDDENK